MAGGKAGKDTGKSKQKAVSRSARAGLQFPVGRWKLFSYFMQVCVWFLKLFRNLGFQP